MTVLYLLFKAYQPGLFDSPVEVTGHVTKRGTVVAPYRSTRKKRPEPPPAPDLFAEADRKAMEEDRKKAEEAARQEKERQEREAEAAKKEAERKAQEEAEKKAKKAKPAKKAQEDDSDDPNSPNYRFRDTGYIAGSRKEDAARFIRAAGRDGRRVNRR